MPYAVPDGQRVHVRALPIALWCSDYTQGTFCEDRAQQERFKVGFSPLPGAYVACIRTADAFSSLPAPRWQLRCGRTNDFGWVLQRERTGLGAEGDTPRSGWKKKPAPPGGVRDPDAVPADAGVEPYDEDVTDAADAGVPKPRELSTFGPDDAAMFELDSRDANAEALSVLPNEQHRIFWCYDQRLFSKFLDDFDANPGAAITRYEVPLYRVEPFRALTPVDMLRELAPREQAFVARLMAPDGEGYHGGWPSLEGMSAAIFDATPRALRTLYLCEWLHWCCLHWMHDDPHWPYLLALRATIRASRSGAPIPDLARRLPDGGPEDGGPSESQIRGPSSQPQPSANPELAKGRRAGQLRHYLHQLAWAGMDDRAQATALVDVWGASRMHGHWREIAAAMQRRYGFGHPAMEAADLREFRFSDDERDALVAYFDMYALGFQRAADAEALDAHWQHIEAALGWLRDRQHQLLSAVGHVQVKRTLGLCIPRHEPERKIDLADRYHKLCADLGIAFWEPAHTALANQAAWDEHKPFVTWLAESSGLLGETFERFLAHYLPAYRQLTSASCERLVQYLYRYHLVLHNKAIETTLPAQDVTVRLEPDAASGRAVAKLFRGGKQTRLLELELLTAVHSAPDAEAHAPVGADDPGTRFKRYRRAMAKGEVRTFRAREQTLRVPDADSAALESFPKALAAAGALLKTGLAVAALVDAVREHDWRDVDSELYLDVTQESLQALEPGASLLAPLFARAGSAGGPLARRVMQGAEQLGRAGLLLESVRNLVSGAATLATFLGPATAETDLARYLDRRHSLPALLETTKGLVQVATGSAGVAGVVLGTGTVVATAPLSAWVAVGLTAVSMLDVLIYVDTGGPSPVDDFKRTVKGAYRAQFALCPTADGHDDRILMPNEETAVPGPDGSHKRLASSLLARKIGSVHHVLKMSRTGSK